MVLCFCCSFCWGEVNGRFFICLLKKKNLVMTLFSVGKKQEPVKSARRGDLAGYRAAQEPTVRVSG
jgi:hypothetical protein